MPACEPGQEPQDRQVDQDPYRHANECAIDRSRQCFFLIEAKCLDRRAQIIEKPERKNFPDIGKVAQGLFGIW